ncbi:hypothetical protein [Rhizobium sp. SSA_523]|uniref:hypothetical protein n=1 Tax=Rhizobium sp. SSA_523 TaxID=2952477 RepID=UPI00209130A2|nr:hypothetical protein [Rhizobium sp. SSA_523]MCO5730652.1 hypothetical protein [Rhizobium sp. SSA_523]WKC24518.1 hypothetical protein QTJ18_10710 [Rhizobium sp. SSA_523]
MSRRRGHEAGDAAPGGPQCGLGVGLIVDTLPYYKILIGVDKRVNELAAFKAAIAQAFDHGCTGTGFRSNDEEGRCNSAPAFFVLNLRLRAAVIQPPFIK